jgi:hypothetical protein
MSAGYINLYQPIHHYLAERCIFGLESCNQNRAQYVCVGILIMQLRVSDHILAEHHILEVFRTKFTVVDDPELNLFEGNSDEMCREIFNYEFGNIPRIHINDDRAEDRTEEKVPHPAKKQSEIAVAKPVTMPIAMPADISQTRSNLGVTEVDIERAHDFVDRFVRSGLSAAAEAVKKYAFPQSVTIRTEAEMANVNDDRYARSVVKHTYFIIRNDVSELASTGILAEYEDIMRACRIDFIRENTSPKCSMLSRTVINFELFIAKLSTKLTREKCEDVAKYVAIYNTIVGLESTVNMYTIERLNLSNPYEYVSFRPTQAGELIIKSSFEMMLAECPDFIENGDIYLKKAEKYFKS